tara:strand:+ start:6037 stop:6504 length:468 start_codon:yes stop_codon:yes gene_type:complete
MFLIAHRGNIIGPHPEKENHPDYLLEAVNTGFEVEVDIWSYDNMWLLGHDGPQYEVDDSYLTSLHARNALWLHAKNADALSKLSSGGVYENWRFFWHQQDDYTLTSNGYLWTYPGKELMHNSICVMPESPSRSMLRCAGICSDHIKEYKKFKISE